ncbi:MAG: hypothetical protein EBT06_06570 [Gammaproteobacteria bacterium]|nr:hypothetical protein [Gammaproteobacteria bacterium]NBT44575.1 hypothetical protein [Gammaproteobacteria bacterium]NBY21855.1 hypothetical protein [Gammaproteobacteria bacterium]
MELVLMLGMLDRNEAFAIPVEEMKVLLPHLSEITKKLPKKWNITLALQDDGNLVMYVPEPIGHIGLNQYRFPV